MKDRLLSIDVLRGMTIFFMIIVNTPGSWSHVYAPLLHAKWHGCTPTDLVFPFFLFIVGVSMSISFRKYKDGDRGAWVKKVLKRTALIFLVGVLLNWFPFFHKNIADLRIFGVLQRIALAFGGAGLLVIFIRDKSMLATVTAFILLGYWALMYFAGGADPFSLEGNLATYFDTLLLGENHVYGGFGIPFDPEGIISTISGVPHVLIGYFVGLKIQELSDKKLFLVHSLFVIGAALTVLGLVWNIAFPINKPIWTSSYVLLSTGLGTLFLSLLIYLIDGNGTKKFSSFLGAIGLIAILFSILIKFLDVHEWPIFTNYMKIFGLVAIIISGLMRIKGWDKWTYVFKVFGLNPLASYVLSGLFIKVFMHVFDVNPYPWLYENVFSQIISMKFGSFLQALTYTLFIWLFAWLLYRNNKVIKL